MFFTQLITFDVHTLQIDCSKSHFKPHVRKYPKLALGPIGQRLRLILTYSAGKAKRLFLMFKCNYYNWGSNPVFTLGARSEEEPDGTWSKKQCVQQVCVHYHTYLSAKSKTAKIIK